MYPYNIDIIVPRESLISIFDINVNYNYFIIETYSDTPSSDNADPNFNIKVSEIYI